MANSGGRPGGPMVTRRPPAHGAGAVTKGTWALALLLRLGIAPSGANRSFVIAWENAEGGHWNNSARYNPLNTTLKKSGSHSMNTVGVQSYTSWAQGMDATVETLHNGHYAGILKAMKGNDAGAMADAVGASPWGTPGAGIRANLNSARTGVSGSGSADTVGAVTNALGQFGPIPALFGQGVDNAAGIASGAANAAMSIPKFLGKLQVIFDGTFWLRAGQILLGVAALALGTIIIGKQYLPINVQLSK